MSKNHSIPWEADEHTKIKIQILRNYLKAWFPICCRQFDSIVYIDGMCGPGEYTNYNYGSPLAALIEANKSPRITEAANKFYFNDADAKCIAHLNKLYSKANYKYLHVDIINQNWSDFIKTVIDELADKNTAGFIFLDPFGFKDIYFSDIIKLLELDSVEILLNFNIQGLNRNKELIEDYFGEMMQIPNDIRDEKEYLLKKYISKMRNIKPNMKILPFEIVGKSNQVIYHLIHFTNHVRGFHKMKDAYWKADPVYGYHFSDRKNPDQLGMFESDYVYDSLIDILKTKYGSLNRIMVGDIRGYVEDDTRFLPKHLNYTFRKLLSEGLLEKHTETYPRKVPEVNYPSECYVTFRF